MKTWITKDGKKLKYSEIKDNHLLNILKYIKGNAKKGITIYDGSYGSVAEDMYCWEEVITGKDVYDLYDYKGLLKEAVRRGLIKRRKYER